MEPGANALHVKLQYVVIASRDGLVRAFATMGKSLVDARWITGLALQHRWLPLVFSEDGEAGGPDGLWS